MVACPAFREHSPAVEARESTEAAHCPAKISYTTPWHTMAFEWSEPPDLRPRGQRHIRPEHKVPAVRVTVV